MLTATYARCGKCGFTHDKCIGQEETERLAHKLGAALVEDSTFAREEALKAYLEWL